MRTFLLGNGWAIAWYLVHYVLLWPLWGFYTYFRDFKPGVGPLGADGIVVLMILYVCVVAGVALLNGIVMIVAVQTAWWMRFLVWPLGLPMVSAAAVCFALFTIMDYAGARHGTSGRVAVGIGVTAFAVVFLGTNFSALAKVRGCKGMVKRRRTNSVFTVLALHTGQRPSQGPTAFEAAPLIKPPALPGVSDPSIYSVIP
jgi:hypothetical protein